MPSAFFWSLIERMGSSASPQAFSSLHDALLELEPGRVAAFQAELDAAIQQLMTPEHLAQKVQDPSEVGVTAAQDLPLMGTAATAAACAVIISGRDTFDLVVREPKALAGARPLAAAIELVDVPARVYEQLTGAGFDDAPRISDGFFDVLGFAWMFEEQPSPAYSQRWIDRAAELSKAPEWLRWWQPAPFERLSLYVESSDGFVFKVKSRTTRSAPATLLVDLLLPPRTEALDTAEAIEQADRDLDQLVGELTKRLKLGPPPALP